MGNFVTQPIAPHGPPQNVLKENIKLLLLEGYIRSIELSKIVSVSVIQTISQYFKQYEDLGLTIGMIGKLVTSTNVYTQYLPKTSELKVSHSVEKPTRFIITNTYTIQHHDSNKIVIEVILTKAHTLSFPQIAKKFVDNKTKCYIKYESTNLYKQRQKDIQMFKIIEENKSNHDGLLKCKIRNMGAFGLNALWYDHRRVKKININKDIFKEIDEIILIAPNVSDIKPYSMIYIYVPKLQIYGWTNINMCHQLKITAFKAKTKLMSNKCVFDLMDKDPIYVYAHSSSQHVLYSNPIPYNEDLTGKTFRWSWYQYLYKWKLLSTQVKYGMICVQWNGNNPGIWSDVPVWVDLQFIKYDPTIKFIDDRKVDYILMYPDIDDIKDDIIVKGTKGMIMESHTHGYVNLDAHVMTYGTYCNYSKYNRFEIVSNGCVKARSDKNYYIKIRLLSNEYNGNIDFEAIQKETWIPLHCTNLYQRNEYLINCMKCIKEFELILETEHDMKSYLENNNYSKSYVHGVTLLNANYYRSNVRSEVKYTAVLNSREEFYLIAPKNMDNVGFGDTICVYNINQNVFGWVKCNDTGLKRYSNEEGDIIGIRPHSQTFACMDPLIPLMPYVKYYANVIVLGEQMTINSIVYTKVQGEAHESPMYKEWFWIPGQHGF
eukprot:323436_1